MVAEELVCEVVIPATEEWPIGHYCERPAIVDLNGTLVCREHLVKEFARLLRDEGMPGEQVALEDIEVWVAKKLMVNTGYEYVCRRKDLAEGSG